jgi:hypothetical protein
MEGRNDPTEFIFRGYRFEEYRPRLLQIFLTDHPGRVRATVSRLRSSWIVAQIDSGLPLPILLAICGLENAAGLDKHVPHTHSLNTADYVGLIVGEEVAR